MTFKELNISAPILRALEIEEYKIPTPIQEAAIPAILEGRDILGSAQTGTGKTAAFAVPTLQNLHETTAPAPSAQGHKSTRSTYPIRSLILTPTRELAIQIYESFRLYGRFLPLKSAVIFGGVSQKPQENELRRGVDILVATPGRLVDLINQKIVDISRIEILTLDEADRMLDMGFIHDVRRVLAHTPAKKQTLFFSATMPPDVAKLASTLLYNPLRISIKPEETTVEAIQQTLYFVDQVNKRHLLRDLLDDPAIESALVFTRTKHGADRVVKDLMRADISAAAIHGNKSQNARVRALDNFKSGDVRILVATDIAARGIDIDELTHVVNFDLPNIPESYVHRIGRTGRAGRGGRAISFANHEEKKLLKDIERFIGQSVPVIEDHDYPLMITTPSETTRQPAGRGQHRGGGAASHSQKDRTPPNRAQRNTSRKNQGSSGR